MKHIHSPAVISVYVPVIYTGENNCLCACVCACLCLCPAGYQRELTYKHNDGSYSAFGQSDESGNTW